MKSGGLGDDILRATYDIGSIKFHSVSIPDTFVKSYGTYEELTKEVGLTSDAIIKISSSWLSR
jgi:transketolase C-terminal domain/subunit